MSELKTMVEIKADPDVVSADAVEQHVVMALNHAFMPYDIGHDKETGRVTFVVRGKGKV